MGILEDMRAVYADPIAADRDRYKAMAVKMREALIMWSTGKAGERADCWTKSAAPKPRRKRK